MRGVFAGLSKNHGPAEMARAVIEGCAFALRDVLAPYSERYAQYRALYDDAEQALA